MKKIALLFCLLFTIGAFAQEKPKEITTEFYGFVRNEFFIDTYKSIDAGHDNLYLLPLYGGRDANGSDLNEQLSSNFTAFTSRLGVKVAGPEIFKAKTNALIEFDFGGILKSEPSLFRILQANTTLTWKKSKLLVGQTWHPFWGGSNIPNILGLNTGAPFQAFSRAPQLRYDIFAGKFTLGAAMTYELQYTTKGIESTNYTTGTQFKRNGVLPELNIMLEFKNKGLTIGGAALYNRTKPRMTTTGTGGTFKADEFIGGKGLMAYVKYVHNKFMFLTKGYYGQNLTHLTMLGGFGVASVDARTGAETYTNYTNYTALANAVYGKKWQVGMLVGIGDNLGTDKALYNDGSNKAKTYGLLQSVQGMFRIAPSISLNVSKIKLMAEYELTTANYGTGTFNFADGLYADTHKTTNNRLNLMMVYSF